LMIGVEIVDERQKADHMGLYQVILNWQQQFKQHVSTTNCC
jgi:hypothetical protein